MGCDIHLTVEARQADGTWKNMDKWKEEDRDYVSNYEDSYYDSRNYDLFSILADVRNGRGFAGVKTGQGFVPMSAPRGVPDDATLEYRRWVEQWSGDGHSHSYFTVAEIMTYDWTQTTRKQGYVSLGEWARWKATGSPQSWTGDVGGGGIVKLAPDVVEAAWKTIEKDVSPYSLIHDSSPLAAALGRPEEDGSPFQEIYTLVTWEIPYYRAGSELLGEVLPRLWRLGKPENVRICFFFDN